MLLFIIISLLSLICLGWDIHRATVEKQIEVIQFNTDKSRSPVAHKVLRINKRRFITWSNVEGKEVKHFELTIYGHEMMPRLTHIEPSISKQYIYIDS